MNIKEDLYVYYEVIKQIGPESIIDVGMFLMRVGNISRQSMSCEIDGTITLDGICFDKKHLPIYGVVYNEIVPVDALWSDDISCRYELGLAISVADRISLDEYKRVIDWLSKHTSYAVVDYNLAVDYDRYGRAEAIESNGEQFVLISF